MLHVQKRSPKRLKLPWMKETDATPSRSGNLLTTAALALAAEAEMVRSACRSSPPACIHGQDPQIPPALPPLVPRLPTHPP